MFRKLLKALNKKQIKRTGQAEENNFIVSDRLDETVQSIQKIVGESDDVVQRDITIAHKHPAALFYIKGLCNVDAIEQDVIKPLLQTQLEISGPSMDMLQTLIKEVLTLSSITVYDSFDDATPSFMSGDALFVIDGIKKLIILHTRGFEERSIAEPQSEVLIRGPRDGFTENLQTNITLVRRRIFDLNLTVQMGLLGRRGKIGFAIAYIKGIANKDLIEEIRYRVSCVDTDDILESGMLEQLIEDNTLSPFPQVMHTERPDRTVGALLGGKVVILVDGTPFALIAPATLNYLLKSPEDYYERWHIGTLIRMLRYFAAFISLFLPALYIAMASYHQGMIPTPLALSTAGAREGVPFPAFVEAFAMEVTIELLREAGIRLPRPVGQTIGIVGGLIIGDAAVRAGVVSPIMVIVVALTAVSSFAIPSYSVSITFRILRFMIMFAAAIFGLYGIIIFYILLNVHLVGLRSFGAYYTSPLAPYRFVDWLDTFLRAPYAVLRFRPSDTRTKDDKKQP